jgi:hypothetical protein
VLPSPAPPSDGTQAPFWHAPPVQGVPFTTGALLHAPVTLSQVPPPMWHASAGQRFGVPTQVPAWQRSATVQGLLSLQPVPFAAGGLVHAPVVGSQTPATWQASIGLQVTLPPPVQAPD